MGAGILVGGNVISFLKIVVSVPFADVLVILVILLWVESITIGFIGFISLTVADSGCPTGIEVGIVVGRSVAEDVGGRVGNFAVGVVGIVAFTDLPFGGVACTSQLAIFAIWLDDIIPKYMYDVCITTSIRSNRSLTLYYLLQD